MARQLELRLYTERNKQLLVDCVESEDGSANEIRSLTRSYVTCLINLGCSTKFIHEEVLRFFYYGPGTISEKAQIRSFVEMFPSEDKKYVALYSAPEEITALSESLQKET